LEGRALSRPTLLPHPRIPETANRSTLRPATPTKMHRWSISSIAAARSKCGPRCARCARSWARNIRSSSTARKSGPTT
jgi:hypothetical protein